MFQEKTIIYFDPFYFKNGNTAKPKYFVILKRIDELSIIASLPTRTDKVPSDKGIDSGCLELADINLNCYVIPKGLEVTDDGKQFDFKTHLYGHQIDDYETKLLQDIYQIEGTDYIIWGIMKVEIFNDLISCLKNSKSVKRKYKILLNK